jgi:DNA-binding CsgD family transcriptional regulator
VSVSVLSDIRGLRKTQIRRYTERRILAVSSGAASDHALISARPTWHKILKLLREGFSKAELARRLGYKRPALQLNRRKITAANAARVDRFYRLIMAGDEEEAA